MIESKDNKKIKYINKLRNNKYMFKEQKFIVEGKHLVEEAFKSGILLETYSTKDVNYGVLNNIVSLPVMKHISILPSSCDLIGVCKFIKENDSLGEKIIILDNVQDPGNLGAIIRSAKAFNIDTIVLSMDSVKKYNEKTIRSAQGMLFKVNVVYKNLKDFIIYLKDIGYKVYGTNVIDGKTLNKTDLRGKTAIVMGNEGQGISKEISSLINENIYIKMNDGCESLNVSVAASIIMYEMSKED